MTAIVDGSLGFTAPVGAVYNGLQTGTAVASTSGTSITFTGIPSWVKRITVMFNGVSTSGSSYLQVQLGAGSVTTTGYLGVIGYINNGSPTVTANLTTGLGVSANNGATDIRYGNATITNVSGNVWTHTASIGLSSSSSYGLASGGISLSGTLDRVRITTVNGTDTFDAGSINILFE